MTIRTAIVSLAARIGLITVCLPLLLSCHLDEPKVSIPEEIDFNFHVRPILSNHCYQCHGPDPSSREADLRLDKEHFALEKRDGGWAAIVPGNVDASLIMERITSHDPGFWMPPPETNKQLTPTDIAILEKWIEDGAEWKPYWAFIAPEDPPVPDSGFGHPVDNYLQPSRDLHQVSSVGQAGKYTLLRRLAYVLTGLPPSKEEIERFLSEDDTTDYEAWVDYYLASPQYGERWARHWMDLARYAEGRGHEFDYPVVGAWRYRDYLIRAFNTDVPYADLVREQLAGDMLSQPRLHPEDGYNESALGTAFLMLAEGKHSPVDIKEEEKIMIDNVIDVTSKTFLGMTVACARCHDHKFDPIPTTDYYALYGIFESTRTHMVPAQFRPEQIETAEQIDSLRGVIRGLLAGQIQDEDLIPQGTPVSGNTSVAKHSNYRVLADFRDGTSNGWLSDGLAFRGGNVLGEPMVNDAQRVQLQRGKVSSKYYGTGLMGTLRSPAFTIDKQKILVRAAGRKSMVRIVVDNFQLIQDPIYGGLDHEIESDEPQDYILDLSMVQGNQAYLEFLSGRMVRQDGKFHHYDIPADAWMEVYYAIMFDSIIPELPKPAPAPIGDMAKAVNAWVTGKANATEKRAVQQIIGNRKFMNPRIEVLQREMNALGYELYDSCFVVGASEGDKMLSPVFIRGDHRNVSEEKIPHRFLTALDPERREFTKTSSGRLELAEAIVQPTNPLTSRVMVNRIWHHLFGRGIVETVDNFGLQGSIPSHPGLLDHLAIKFMEDGWSIKKMIRYLLLTDAFKMGTTADSSNLAKDPRNIYLHHYPVRRLEAEAIRDGILAVSGSLDLTLYGPSIPIHLTSFLSGRGRPPQSGPVDGHGRRSIYQALWRNFLPPMMLAFDMPIPFSTFGKRMVTNVPAQSLTLLNDPFVIDQSRQWAGRLMQMDMDPEEIIGLIYLTAFGRPATRHEIEESMEFLKEQTTQYEITQSEMWTDVRVWKDLCHSIFNMKEFIYLL